ncbi:MAG: hypothetical protein JWM74_2213 [Myxococcaceae bacterium]|nr:hypothetical protein [Myxococcaceae bacterium]
MKAERARPRRAPLVNVLCLVVAVVLGAFAFFRHDTTAPGDALAATPPSSASKASTLPTSSDAAAAPAASAGPTSPSASTLAVDAGAALEPIDLAVAPDGGVPRQLAGTQYRSPFAKPNPGPPLTVRVGLLLNSVDDYDVKTGTFLADFFLSLTSTEPMPALNLQFPNGKLDNKEVIADKPTFKLFRLSGSFKSPADLRSYPFDSQELKIIIEDDLRGIDQLQFSADPERTKLARGFRAVGWQVSFVDAHSQKHSYPDRFEVDDLYYGRYIFAVGLDRFATSAAFKVFVPAFVIVIIALLGMWVPPSEMEVRSNSGAPMLAGAVLFHFALMQELPATSYLTRADKLMMGVYISLALGMLSTWAMFLVKEEKMDQVFRIARSVVPVLTAIVMALAVFG